jgi:hypothetical protein
MLIHTLSVLVMGAPRISTIAPRFLVPVGRIQSKAQEPGGAAVQSHCEGWSSVQRDLARTALEHRDPVGSHEAGLFSDVGLRLFRSQFQHPLLQVVCRPGVFLRVLRQLDLQIPDVHLARPGLIVASGSVGHGWDGGGAEQAGGVAWFKLRISNRSALIARQRPVEREAASPQVCTGQGKEFFCPFFRPLRRCKKLLKLLI